VRKIGSNFCNIQISGRNSEFIHVYLDEFTPQSSEMSGLRLLLKSGKKSSEAWTLFPFSDSKNAAASLLDLQGLAFANHSIIRNLKETNLPGSYCRQSFCLFSSKRLYLPVQDFFLFD